MSKNLSNNLIYFIHACSVEKIDLIRCDIFDFLRFAVVTARGKKGNFQTFIDEEDDDKIIQTRLKELKNKVRRKK